MVSASWSARDSSLILEGHETSSHDSRLPISSPGSTPRREITPFPDRPGLRASRVERTGRPPWGRGSQSRSGPESRADSAPFLPAEPRTRPYPSGRWRTGGGFPQPGTRWAAGEGKSGSSAELAPRRISLAELLKDIFSTCPLFPDQIIVKVGTGSLRGGFRTQFYTLQKSESALALRARGPETPAPPGSLGHLRARLGPQSPVKCDLAASLSVAATGRQGGVCTHAMRSRAPPRSANLGFAVSGFGRDRPDLRLSGDPLSPRRGRYLPLNNILTSSSKAVLGTGFLVSSHPRWPGIYSTGLRDNPLPLCGVQLFGRPRDARGEASPCRTEAWALDLPPLGGSHPAPF